MKAATSSRLTALLLALATVTTASSASERVEIRRTAFGIPHIKASTEQGLGYGVGYAYAQDNGCLLANEIMTVRGLRSRYLGGEGAAADGMRNLESDAFYRWFNQDAALQSFWNAQPPAMQALLKGYAAGYSRVIEEQGGAALDASCKGQAWVNKIDALDMARLVRRLMIRAGTTQFARAILGARPPTAPTAPAVQGAAASLPDWDAFSSHTGSNAIAIGSDLSVNGKGLLLGNPHFPWDGALRFYQMHLSIPGKLDVMGAALPGMPLVNIGYNRSLAWSHTVDTSRHFVVYRLPLDPADPTRYLVDGKSQAMSKTSVAVEVLGKDGQLSTQKHDVYMSAYGPILAIPGKMAWDSRAAFAIHDVNAANTRALQQWYEIAGATSVPRLRESLQRTLGIPWVNTLAADANGRVLFANVSAVPQVDAAKLKDCGLNSGGADGLVILDGARSQCALQSAANTPQPGIFAGKQMPQLERRDYVHNSNDSAWLSNAEQPQTGFPAIVSRDGLTVSGRGRLALDWLTHRVGADARIGPQDLQALLTRNAVYLATPGVDDLLRLCPTIKNDDGAAATPDQAALTQACSALRQWDRRTDTDSGLGYLYFAAAMEQAAKLPDSWAVPFDLRHPVATPRGLRTSDPQLAGKMKETLISVARQLNAAGIAPDARWGSIQGSSRNGVFYPVPGGSGPLGVYNAIESRPLNSSGKREVISGSSYIQVVSFDVKGPHASTLMTFSESSNPGSAHHTDQTQLFGRKQWVSVPFSEAQIAADKELRTTVLELP
ncbi:penicilin amidase [Herbaspirillum sp. CF444]|uniref:bifunctional acylase PvdQ n=1 Tax=Herbaspirillum sp. CF444 TaxID=1144319 RepID=UPI00027239F2|nr:penicillin acylase family protein [Herbaspirillum sp. CF444]EJL90435.1 penicilin amidase [Herbaspirillum sp. CF444]